MPDETPDEYAARQADEYGQFVATRPIIFGGALAYNEGQPVPASNVKAHGYDKDGSVAKVGTKAAAAVTGQPDTNEKKG